MRLFLASAFLILVWLSAARADSLVEIRSIATFDEPRGYCVDMVGSQGRATPDRPLQAHTCYAYQGQIAVDQGVSSEGVGRGQLRFPRFGVCLVGASARAGGAVMLMPCATDASGDVLFDDARIKPLGDEALCLTIASGRSRAGNGATPTHLIRGLSWEICGGGAAEWQAWMLRP